MSSLQWFLAKAKITKKYRIEFLFKKQVPYSPMKKGLKFQY